MQTQNLLVEDVAHTEKGSASSLGKTPRVGTAEDALSGFLRLRSGRGFRRALGRCAPSCLLKMTGLQDAHVAMMAYARRALSASYGTTLCALFGYDRVLHLTQLVNTCLV